MKPSIHHTLPALIAASALLVSVEITGNNSTPANADPQMEELLKKIEAAGTPGAEHKALAPLVGKWNAEVKSWMAPDAPPVVTKATAESRWVMDGRYVQEEFDGEFMGKPFRGMSLTGYDNTTGKYKTVWIDNMSTAMVISEGDVADGGRTFTLTGTYNCPVTDQKDMAMKQVIRVLSQDEHVFEMHDLSKGAGSKTMEITYTRQGN